MGERDTVRSEPGGAGAPAAATLDEDFAARYQRLDLIGQGGMGEVHLCRDDRIGRDVAMKVVRALGPAGPPDQEHRFLREARVQGQLEHPAIVPVYDLGRDPDGTPFFTMKRVNGVTLEQVLDRLAEGDAQTRAEFNRRKLLTAFTSLCLALDYAHERGVLHRDLKPANVMLGGFGEVYVLDWGLARVGAEELAGGSTGPTPAGATLSGAILGTPNFMAPEQVRGELDALDRRSDVYALGSILFEILTLQPLCRGAGVKEILDETLRGVEARASVRLPDLDVPPELEAICVRATRRERDQRFATARELCHAVERYLDGDRDLELRRALAEQHAQAAEAAARRAVTDDRELEARALALRECGRALAFDPQNRGALQALLGLLTQPPRRLPKDAEAEFLRTAREGQSDAARIGFWAYATWFLYLPFVLWMGVKDWLFFLIPGPLWIAASIQAWLVTRNPHAQGKMPYPLIIASSVAVAATAVMFGAFILLPCIAVVNTISFMMSQDRTRRPAVIVAGLMSILLPIILEVTGVFAPTYHFTGDEMVVGSLALHLPPVPTKLFLIVTNLAIVVTSALMMGRMRDLLSAKERQLHLHAWQLRQLVPDPATRLPQPAPAGLGCTILGD